MATTFGWAHWCARSRLLTALDIVLRGCSQVMFQSNPLTGLLFFVAIFMGAYSEGLPQVAFGCLLGTVTSTLCAAAIVSDRQALRAGLFGYNGCLVGAALPTFLVASPLLWGYVVFSSLISVIATMGLSRMLRAWKVAALTAPFVFTTWIVLLGSYAFGHLNHARLPMPAMPPGSATFADGSLSVMEMMVATLHGVSQVFLFSSALGGFLLLVGLAVASLWAMLLGFVGALLAVLTAQLIGANPQHITAGLYAFSAVLTAVALGSAFNRPGWRVLLYTLIGVIFTVLVQGALNTLLAPLGIPSLTMPFVLASWLFLIANREVLPEERQ